MSNTIIKDKSQNITDREKIILTLKFRIKQRINGKHLVIKAKYLSLNPNRHAAHSLNLWSSNFSFIIYVTDCITRYWFIVILNLNLES